MPRTKIDIESRFTLKVLVVLSEDCQGSLSRRLDTPLTGRDFWKGAVTGATIGYLNHAMHQAVVGEEGKIDLKKYNKDKYIGFEVDSLEEGLEIIHAYSQANEIEMGLMELTNPNGDKYYYVMPWDRNNRTSCDWYYQREVTGFSEATNRVKYHTHVTNNGPSYTDYMNNSTNSHWVKNQYNASYVVNKTSVWLVDRFDGVIPPRNVSDTYGSRISSISEFLNNL